MSTPRAILGDPDHFWTRLAEALRAVPEEARTPPSGARIGSVLVLLEDTAQGPSVVLTRRRRDLRSHPGQVSFPGGRVDPGEGLVDAALREAHEEIALDAGSVEVVGVAETFYIPPSRFWVTPVVARWRRPHALRENPWEVDTVLHTPLADLLDEDRWRHAPLSLRGSSWAWALSEDVLWGATAFAMSRLLDLTVPGWHGGRRPEDLGGDRAVRPWEAVPTVTAPPRLVGELPSWSHEDVPHVGATQVRDVRRWLETHGVSAGVMAEQAGRAVAHAVRRLVDGSLEGTAVTVLAGPSRNGAGGLAAARLLMAAGARVDVRLLGPSRIPGQVALLRRAGALVSGYESFRGAPPPGEVVVDAVLGIGAVPPLHGVPQAAAEWLRRTAAPVVAVELPSGISADHGLHGPCITADVTIALGLPVRGAAHRVVQAYLGDLYLADLGIPPAVWAEVGVAGAPVFADGPLVRLTAQRRGSDASTPDQGERPATSPPAEGGGD